MQNETFSVLKRFRFRNEIIISFHIEKISISFYIAISQKNKCSGL